MNLNYFLCSPTLCQRVRGSGLRWSATASEPAPLNHTKASSLSEKSVGYEPSPIFPLRLKGSLVIGIPFGRGGSEGNAWLRGCQSSIGGVFDHSLQMSFGKLNEINEFAETRISGLAVVEAIIDLLRDYHQPEQTKD